MNDLEKLMFPDRNTDLLHVTTFFIGVNKDFVIESIEWFVFFDQFPKELSDDYPEKKYNKGIKLEKGLGYFEFRQYVNKFTRKIQNEIPFKKGCVLSESKRSLVNFDIDVESYNTFINKKKEVV